MELIAICGFGDHSTEVRARDTGFSIRHDATLANRAVGRHTETYI
jgi:hypothetical protein